MTNIHPLIVEKLSEVLPTYFDLFLSPTGKIPCISYTLANDYEIAKGNTIGYSDLHFRVKVWANRVEDICEYSRQIDDKLAELATVIGRFTRVGTNLLSDSELLCQIIEYRVLASENYNRD